jgi:Tat protein secretion system quality control protein TatD with DNase activity
LFLDSNNDRSVELEKLLPYLPDPSSLDHVLSELRHNLGLFPQAMLGEVGLDRSFRVPLDFSASPRELTTFTIPFKHQISVLEAQLDVAVELGRNVSFHSVKAHNHTLELFDRMSGKHGGKWKDISIDMHSCGFSSQMWKDMEVPNPMTPVIPFSCIAISESIRMFFSHFRPSSMVDPPTTSL